MPKKGKVNKLARMSDEERARYLQHRADIEEEARRRKRDLIALFIKNKLDKEQAYSRTNTAKLNQAWRYILRRVKCKQMALEIQGAMSSFNFMVERKDRLLASLSRAVEDSDEQHRRAFQAHTETLSYFLNIGTQRLDKLQTEYEHQKNSLLDSWDKEEGDKIVSQEQAETKLILITYIQDRDFQTDKKEKELKRATAKNDARLEHEEEIRSLCRPKKLQIEMYWNQLRDVYNSYLERFNPIMSHYHSLREKDDFYQQDIAKNEIQIQQASDLILTLQKEWLKSTNTMAAKLKRMFAHKEDLARKYWQMKRDAKTERSRTEEYLATMVDASQDATKRLEEVKEKLDKITQMAEICRKYEVEGDNDVMQSESSGEMLEFENLDCAMINEYKEYSKMDKLMLKINKVKLQTICLRAEKNKLASENVQLKHYIKRFLTELALKGTKARPLSVSQLSKTQKTDAGKALNRPVTCVEGALSNAVLHEKRMKLEARKQKEYAIRSYPRVQCWIDNAS
ncbi:dynein regulatory complex subunit 2, partial [Cydia pomonella]|uniref:dynein regulatory complex subunit 2 n=1 Tax=Cydia pomonella TaxID=82600 RepID=UPI002ADDC410